MLEILSEKLKSLASACGFPLYVVGGTCREYLSGVRPLRRDWDICAPASPQELAALAQREGFETCAVYKNTGTVKLRADGEEYEFTSFRSDKYVRGMHTPAKIYFTDDILLDARRRDFTCNAVYYDICAGQFVDPLGGIADIAAKLVRTVAPAKKVFGEDGLRLMRLARLCGVTGFSPDEECMAGAAENCALIDDISAERVYAELHAILHADEKYGEDGGQYRALCVLRGTGVLGRILPELAGGAGMSQRSDFHKYDVLEHSLRCVMYAPPGIRLAALLHDVGKPYCKVTTGTFHKHEEEGERIALEICRRLKVPKKLAERTVRLVRLHMYDLDCNARESKVRRLIINNFDIFEELLQLKQADFSACRDDLSVAPTVKKWRAVYDDMKKEGVPFSVGELNVRGGDLIAAGVPAKNCGRVLQALLSECAMLPALNERPRLIAAAQRIARTYRDEEDR